MRYDPKIESHYGITLVTPHRVRKEACFGTRECYLHTKAVIEHFIRNPDPMVVPVYSFEEILATTDNAFGTYSYAYEMQRLGMLDHYERRIINEFHEWDSEVDRDNHLENFRVGWNAYPRLMEYMNTIYRQKRYRDVHSENFGVDEQGNYRIMDLEGFSTYPLDQSINDWITR